MSAITQLKAALKRFPIVGRLNERLFGQSREINRFLQTFFARPVPKTIVQVGANDGEMADPLRPYLRQSGSYRAILLEPVPYYVDKLRRLYAGRSDVEVMNLAPGPEPRSSTLYYLPPAVADRMDGDGPANGWAHGQGSFDRSTIVHWIQRNSFRGADYVRQIPEFIAAIASVEVPVTPVGHLHAGGEDTLLVIDAQGFELEVLKGIDWRAPPENVMFEDDLEGDGQVEAFLEARGYRYVCGKTDKVYALAPASMGPARAAS